MAAFRHWVLLLFVFGLLAATVEWAARPPAPVPASAPAVAFSAERAATTVRYLAGDIGLRVAGTPGQRAAADYLARALRSIPGLEVQVQDQDGVSNLTSPFVQNTIVYRTRNVLARLPGDSPEALLLSAHYDSPPESPGAADNAAQVAALLEIARNLAAGGKLRHTIIFNFNGAEEVGLAGAAGFTRHEWMAQVRAYINLDAAGDDGRAVLFQTGPGHPWLVMAYRRAVDRPYGSVVGQDLFQSGLVPLDTDARIYREQAKLPGLDLALFHDGYAYHTGLDTPARLRTGSLQHVGETVLALTRELAAGQLGGDSSVVASASSVYYDVLGLFMIAYSTRTASVLRLVGVLLAVASVVHAVRRRRLTLKGLLSGTVLALAGLLAGEATALAAALLWPRLLNKPHGWYSATWLGVAAYGTCALAGVLAVHTAWAARWNKRSIDRDQRVINVVAGTLVVSVILLALLRIGSGYLALWWCISLSLMLAALAVPTARLRPWYLLAALPSGLLTAQAFGLLVHLFVPVAGRLAVAFPVDAIFAALVATPVAGLAIVGVAWLNHMPGLGRIAIATAALGIVAVIATSTRSPYTAREPKLLAVEVVDGTHSASLHVRSLDPLDPAPMLAAIAGFTRSHDAPMLAPDYERPTEALPVPPLALTVTPGRAGSPAEGWKTLRVPPQPWGKITLKIPKEGLVAWSLSPSLPPVPKHQDSYVVTVVGHDQGESVIELETRPGTTVTIEETFAPYTAPAIEAVRTRLPVWSTSIASAIRRRSITL